MDVQLPDGRVLRGVPDGTTKAQLAQKLAANGIKIPGISALSESDMAAGGAGGYNPMLSRLGGAVQAGGEALGMTPENTANPLANALGPLETVAQMGTGAAGTVAGGLAGIGQGIKNQVSPGMPAADRVRQVQGAMTYQPRIGAGNAASRVIGAPGEIYQAATNRLAEPIADAGYPGVATAVKTTGDVIPAILGARFSMTGPGAVPRAPRGAKANYVSTKNDVPTTQQLTAASREAYKAGEESGVVVPAESYAKAVEGTRKMVTTEGLDPTLHPKSTAVMKRLEESSGKELTLQEAETLRKIALDAEDDLNPVTRQPTPDARIAGKIVDELDEQINALSVNSPARALWSRSRRSQMIDRAIERAEIKAGAHYTQAGMEHAIRQEFKQLALNERRMRGLTADQKAAIKKIASGGLLENTMRALGKFDPTTSPIAAASSLGTSALLSILSPAAAALPAAGFLGKRAATKMTERNVSKAREALVGRGIPSAVPLTKATPTPQSAVSQKLPGATDLRSAAGIREQIRQLERRAGNLPAGTRPDSPQARALFQELALLEHQLKLVESRGAASSASDGTPSQ